MFLLLSCFAFAQESAAPSLPPSLSEPKPWELGVQFSGYIQTQYEHHQLSEDEISPDGDSLNQDRFLVRRARLIAIRDFEYGQIEFELDANTVNRPTVGVRRANISGFVPGPTADRPYVRVTAGLIDIPYGGELANGNRERIFMERSKGSLAWFPGEPDIGVLVSGAVGPAVYAAAVQNGAPLDGDSLVTQKKTLVGRVGFDDRAESHQMAAGVSFLNGTGLHEGTPSTKGQLTWRDSNQDGNVTLNELVASPGQAATKSVTFARWAVGADANVDFETPIGWTRLQGEVTMATNLDRGYMVADPVSTGYDLREFGWAAGFTQDVTERGVIGFRADSYDANSDFFEARRGQFEPTSTKVTTLSPLIGLVQPNRGRLVFQYDHVIDSLGRDDAALPIDLKNDVWTVRLQAGF